MTDHYTDQLFEFDTKGQKTLGFPVSRLLIDHERFVSDSDEVMSKVGMGSLNEKTHKETLKEASKIRDEFYIYQPHHETFCQDVHAPLSLNPKGCNSRLS